MIALLLNKLAANMEVLEALAILLGAIVILLQTLTSIRPKKKSPYGSGSFYLPVQHRVLGIEFYLPIVMKPHIYIFYLSM